MSDQFTFKYFAEEYCRFRDIMGNRDLMVNKPEKVLAAYKGLCHVYFNVEPSEKDEQLKTMMASLQVELRMRARLLLEMEEEKRCDWETRKELGGEYVFKRCGRPGEICKDGPAWQIGHVRCKTHKKESNASKPNKRRS